MATTLKGKGSSNSTSTSSSLGVTVNGSLSPRMNGHAAAATSPRSPTSPLLHGGPSTSTSTSTSSGYARAGSSNNRSTANGPSSPMNGVSPSLGPPPQQHHHHHQPYDHQPQQRHQQPPRFRQQKNSSSNSSDAQYANFSPSAYHHQLSPAPSTSASSSLAVPATTSTGSSSTPRNTYSGNNSHSPSSPNGISSTNPTIASMQSHHHSPKQYSSQQLHQSNGQAVASSSAGSSLSTSPHYTATAAPHQPSSSTFNTHSTPHYNPPSARLPRPSETFTRELSNVLQHTFIPSILPSAEEYQVKENARKYLEYLADRVTPGAKLLPFGSQANGLALRNSDMDLCYISPPGKPRKPPSELVELLGRMIEVEAPVFAVKMLSRARIPIIKLSPSPIYHLRRQEAEATQQRLQQQQQQVEGSTRKVSSASAPASANTSRPASSSKEEESSREPRQTASSSYQTNPSNGTLRADSTNSTSPSTSTSKLPSPPPMPEYGLSCDIGFENRLALENTRLLLTYAMADPRLRTIVLFLKVWTKRRKINNSYLGTLSSYGYVLLVIHFLINIRKPPVLPNLQRLRPPGVTPVGQTEYDGRDIYFFDDLELLPRYWQSTNRDNVGELLIAFFHYYHKEFRYTFDVVSIRSEGGILNKVHKGWMNDQPMDHAVDPAAQAAGKDGAATTTPGHNRNIPRDLNRLCIEDPFQTDYNVARTVTVDGLFTIRGEIARATSILRGTRSDVNAVIAELLEEREDYLVHAPPPNSNRRRSAPSPRLQPSVLATHQDFRTWALANGVPHAQGGNMPMFPHQLQGVPLIEDINGTSQGNNGLTAISAETLARYQQASQALSQANLQQQQAQQQQLLANLPALLAASTLRNSTRSTSRRFHEHSYKQMRQQQGNAAMQQQHQNVFGQQLLSPQQAQHAFQNNALFSHSVNQLHPSSSSASPSSHSFSRSQNAAGHLARPPILERRSSWDGSAASDETRQNFRGSSSVSEAGVGPAPPDMGTTTAPTSPATHNAQLPAFATHVTYPAGPSSIASPTLSTVSVATAPAGSFAQYGTSQNSGRQGRETRSQWPPSSSSASFARSSSHTSRNDLQYARSPGRYGQYDLPLASGTSIPMQAFPTGLPMGHLPVAETTPVDYAARAAELLTKGGSALSTTSASTSVLASPTFNVSGASLEERDPVLDDDTIPSPSSIRFGNFDAAFYSSEPTDMAGLGLYDAASSTDGSPLSLSGTPSFDDSIIPEEVALPPPVRLPSQQLASFAASMRAAQRFRPQLADIPASPAAKHVAGPDASSRRPSLQSNRRRSAGDEAGLGLGDVTFFGKIPVSKNEGEREKAMASLLKESGKDFKPTSVPSSSTTSQGDACSDTKFGALAVASTASTTKPTSSMSTENHPTSPPVIPVSHEGSSSSASTLTPAESKESVPTKVGPSYAALAASRSSGKIKRTVT